MTEAELIEACINDSEEERTFEAAEEWLQGVTSYIEGSTTRRRRAYIRRNREEGHAHLFNDYFAVNPVYTNTQFRQRFRMQRHAFLRIVETLENHSPYFQMRRDARGENVLSSLQKCTAAIRMLAYGMPTDCVDEYVRIGKTTTLECRRKFVQAVNEIFGAQYLRKPNTDDIQRLLQWGERRGFPSMIESIDCIICMHWEWRNCPVAWKSQYCRGDHGKPIIMLEAVASQDLWIWYAFFGCLGSNNDINVFGQSPVFNEIYEGRAPQVNYTVNDTEYHMGYYLVDSIYPEWTTFVKTILLPQGQKIKLFTERQEGARKDVEGAFGVLQTRFAIVCGPGRVWDNEVLKDIIYACIILHNMIVEDERDTYSGHFDDYTYDHPNNDIPIASIDHAPLINYETYIQRTIQIRDRASYHQLQADLIKHLWQRFGEEN